MFRFKTIEMQRGGGGGEGYKFVPGKMFSGIKSDFSRVSIPGGKYGIAITHFILERNFL